MSFHKLFFPNENKEKEETDRYSAPIIREIKEEQIIKEKKEKEDVSVA
jgi:hypothetical protein